MAGGSTFRSPRSYTNGGPVLPGWWLPVRPPRPLEGGTRRRDGPFAVPVRVPRAGRDPDGPVRPLAVEDRGRRVLGDRNRCRGSDSARAGRARLALLRSGARVAPG